MIEEKQHAFFQDLKQFRLTKEYLVVVDTDGCIVDNMSGKQILLFHPLYMEFYGLWNIESYFREIAEFYNLFSAYRGSNRFISLNLTIKTLNERADVKNVARKKGVNIPDNRLIVDFIEFCEKKGFGLSNLSLKNFISGRFLDFEGYKLYSWSMAVNEVLPLLSKKFEPFENAVKCLEIMSENADVVVFSQTPYNDLFEYWSSYGLLKYIRLILSQETGSKTYQISLLKKAGYPDDKILAIGDSFGDFDAAKNNNVHFYPVVPGKEECCWEKFFSAFEDFLKGRYEEQEKDYLVEFKKFLPDSPPWERQDYDHVISYRENQHLRKSLYEKFNPEGRLLIL